MAVSTLKLAKSSKDGTQYFSELTKALNRCDPAKTCSIAGGLLTIPDFAPENYRLNFFSYLCASSSFGKRRPTIFKVKRWIEKELGHSPLQRYEDPPEDVFIANVIAPGGNYRIFRGTWEGSDYYLQNVLDVIFLHQDSEQWRQLKDQCRALLKLSEAIAERSKLKRNTEPPDRGPRRKFLGLFLPLYKIRKRVVFTEQDLENQRIHPYQLNPFIYDRPTSISDEMELADHYILEKQPLVMLNDHWICVSPQNIPVAICNHIISGMQALGQLDKFQSSLDKLQTQTLYRDLFPRLFQTSVKLEPLAVKSGNQLATLAAAQVDLDRYLFICFFRVELSDVVKVDLNTPWEPSPGLLQRIEEAIGQHPKYSTNSVLLYSYGGVGNGFKVSGPEKLNCKNVILFPLHDIRSLISRPGITFYRLMKLILEEAELRNTGVRLINMSGLLNLYSYWETNHYTLVPNGRHTLQGIGMLNIDSNYYLKLRCDERKRVDVHAAKVNTRGDYLRVERLNPNSYFPSMSKRSIFVATDLVKRGELRGVIEKHELIIWVVNHRDEKNTNLGDLTFKIWKSLLEWMEYGLVFLPDELKNYPYPITINLALDDSADWTYVFNPDRDIPETGPTSSVDTESNQLNIVIPPGIVRLLQKEENIGERVLLIEAWKGLLTLLRQASEFTVEKMAVEIASNTLRGPDRRQIHLITAKEPHEYITQLSGQPPRFIPPEDQRIAEQDLATWLQNAGYGFPSIITPEDSQDMLHKSVDEIWNQIRIELEGYNKTDVITLCLRNLESISGERSHWKLSTRALLAMVEDTDEAYKVMNSRERDRAVSAISTRVLAEMSASTSKKHGGIPFSWRAYDRLCSKISLLLEISTHSDILRAEIGKPSIKINSSGRVILSSDLTELIAHPYTELLHSFSVDSAALKYSERFRVAKDIKDEEIFSEPYRLAFKAEYNLSISELFDAVGVLVEKSIVEKSVVVTSTFKQLCAEMKKELRQDTQIARAALDFLCLPVRQKWDISPPGYNDSDWYPWRFRRRLSVSYHPILRTGSRDKDGVLYGVDQLLTSVYHRITGIEAGYFPSEFFHRSELRAFVGDAAKNRGHEFTEQVSNELRSFDWETQTEINISTLGGPPELGDIDVLAWRKDTKEIFIIECKNLIPRRNIFELVEELLQFKGEAKDRLGRHLNRVEWFKNNTNSVVKKTGFNLKKPKIDSCFLTNRIVPMRFRGDLPLQSDKFVSFRELQEFFRRN